MSAYVTIEGSLTPSVELAKGERRTVALTPRVQSLIDKGYVTVVESHDFTPDGLDVEPRAEKELAAPPAEPEPAGDPAPTPEPEPAVDPEPTAEPEPAVDPEPTAEPAPVAGPVADPPPVAGPVADPPPNNASREKWAAFLGEQDIPVPADAPRDGLIKIWEQHQAGSGA